MFEELLVGVTALTALGAVANTVAAWVRSRHQPDGRRTVEVTIHGKTLRLEGNDEAEIARFVQAFVKLQETERQETERASDREEDGGRPA